MRLECTSRHVLAPESQVSCGSQEQEQWTMLLCFVKSILVTEESTALTPTCAMTQDCNLKK